MTNNDRKMHAAEASNLINTVFQTVDLLLKSTQLAGLILSNHICKTFRLKFMRRKDNEIFKVRYQNYI
jgi:hypothetical protein